MLSMVSLRVRVLGLLTAGLFPLAALLPAQNTTAPVSSARTMRYDATTRQAVLTGDARLAVGDYVLTADEIRYDQTTGNATARGHFVLTAGQRRLVADDGTYNFNTRSLHVRQLRLGQFPVYLTGETVDGTIDDFVITHATIFVRENALYAPSIKAERLTYQRGRIVSGEGMKVGLLGGHVIALPKFEHDLNTDLISYVNGKLGYRGNLGVFAEFGTHLPVAPGLKLGADGGLYSARGLMVGPSAAYARTTQDGTFRGYLRTGYIHDTGELGQDILGRAVPADRSYIEWQHRQQIGENLTLDGQFNYWSDSEILRDFRPKQFNAVQQPDSFLESTYTNPNYVVSLFARLHPNRYHRVQERLPELTFDLLPNPAPLPGFFERAHASLAVLDEDAWQTHAAVRSTRYDAYYGLERPWAPTSWFTLTPVAGARLTYYADATGGKNTYTRALGEVGFDAGLRASGTSDYKNSLWEIDGLRHLLEPKLSYRYAPQAADGTAYIPAIDRRVFNTYLAPLSIADTRNIDDLTRLDTMRLSLNNSFQTRRTTPTTDSATHDTTTETSYGSRDLATLNLAADYQFAHSSSTHALNAIHTELALIPAPWLRLEAYERFSPQNFDHQELNFAFDITDQQWWSLRFGTAFLRADYEQYTLDYRQRLSEVYDLFARWRYDARLSRLNEQTYGLTQRLGQTWTVRYEVSFTQGASRESNFGFNIEVELLKF